MKKIPSVFQRNYETDRLCRDEVVPGCEWVLSGEGVATIKWDGTACMILDGQLFKRYDRKWDKKRQQYKPAPDGWEPCEDQPNEHTGHWPGWLPVGDGPEDRWHREAFAEICELAGDAECITEGTYELVGEKVQDNPYNYDSHMLISHDEIDGVLDEADFGRDTENRTFESIKALVADESEGPLEGIVFHHPDGRLAKVKRKDFGLPWPVKEKMK